MTWRPTLLLAALLYVAPSLPGAAESIDTALRDAARSWLQAAGSATEGAQFEFSDRERRNWHFTPRGAKGS